jgi:hypothetical protein
MTSHPLVTQGLDGRRPAATIRGKPAPAAPAPAPSRARARREATSEDLSSALDETQVRPGVKGSRVLF